MPKSREIMRLLINFQYVRTNCRRCKGHTQEEQNGKVDSDGRIQIDTENKQRNINRRKGTIIKKKGQEMIGILLNYNVTIIYYQYCLLLP